MRSHISCGKCLAWGFSKIQLMEPLFETCEGSSEQETEKFFEK